MLKSDPEQGSAAEPSASPADGDPPDVDAQPAATADSAVPGIFTSPFKGILTGDGRDQRESAKRHAHRLRMRDYFARVKTAI